MRKQCPHLVGIALTTLNKYKCLLEKGHEGQHIIGISNDFYLSKKVNDSNNQFGSISDLGYKE